MKLTTMMKLFGSVSDRKKNLQLCHQELLEKKGVLTRFEDLPMGAFVMFVSHQWNGFQHPDPNGVQIVVTALGDDSKREQYSHFDASNVQRFYDSHVNR